MPASNHQSDEKAGQNCTASTKTCHSPARPSTTIVLCATKRDATQISNTKRSSVRPRKKNADKLLRICSRLCPWKWQTEAPLWMCSVGRMSKGFLTGIP